MTSDQKLIAGTMLADRMILGYVLATVLAKKDDPMGSFNKLYAGFKETGERMNQDFGGDAESNAIIQHRIDQIMNMTEVSLAAATKIR